ncbi:hypothetical protein B0H66DRAFT_315525 [Apodospora peruviana]|uniref:DUF1275 domain protein n=1 Tax=Apodospora peruviana TaxID=516989 RepID=A0AAE0HX95_9PEZI|nr:hypothetical protein B0H66DRAFT_315525 [Apodospora peruviana]
MSSPREYGTLSAGEEEQQPLLRKGETPWRKRLTTNVNRDWADLVLLLCYVITGLLDSSSISIWGSFVSMQTGNTVYIGLGLAAPSEDTRWIKSGTSLLSFCLGSFLFSRFHRCFSPARRWVLCVSFFVQMLFITGAALILTFGPASAKGEVTWNVLVPIALIAFQSCGQAVTSRALKYNALTSVVLTSIYCDLFSDAQLFAVNNAERNRRLAAPVLLLFGAVMGGLFAHSSLGIAGALWTAVVLKLITVICWLFWPAEPSSESD